MHQLLDQQSRHSEFLMHSTKTWLSYWVETNLSCWIREALSLFLQCLHSVSSRFHLNKSILIRKYLTWLTDFYSVWLLNYVYWFYFGDQHCQLSRRPIVGRTSQYLQADRKFTVQNVAQTCGAQCVQRAGQIVDISASQWRCASSSSFGPQCRTVSGQKRTLYTVYKRDCFIIIRESKSTSLHVGISRITSREYLTQQMLTILSKSRLKLKKKDNWFLATKYRQFVRITVFKLEKFGKNKARSLSFK